MNTQLHLQQSLSMVFVAFHQLKTYNGSDYAILHVKCIIALFKQFFKYEQWTVQHIAMWRLFKVQKENVHIQNIKQNPTNKRSQSNRDHILIYDIWWTVDFILPLCIACQLVCFITLFEHHKFIIVMFFTCFIFFLIVFFFFLVFFFPLCLFLVEYI